MILCVCQAGHSRSVALTRLLHSRGKEAIACGWHTSPSTLADLSCMADCIFVMQAKFIEAIPTEYRHKVDTHFDVGPDRWSNPYHPELASILKTMIGTYNGRWPI